MLSRREVLTSKPCQNLGISTSLSKYLAFLKPTDPPQNPPVPNPPLAIWLGQRIWTSPFSPSKPTNHPMKSTPVSCGGVASGAPHLQGAPGFVVAPRGAPPPTVTRVERVEPCWVRSERCPFLEEVKKARSVGGRETVEEPFLLSP